MKILVIGGAGWTATAIIEALIDDGHTVTSFDLPDIKPHQRLIIISKAISKTLRTYKQLFMEWMLWFI